MIRVRVSICRVEIDVDLYHVPPCDVLSLLLESLIKKSSLKLLGRPQIRNRI